MPQTTKTTWSKSEMADEVIAIISPGASINLGIGMPTLIAERIPDSLGVTIHSENGVLGVSGRPTRETVSPTLINAGKETMREAGFEMAGRTGRAIGYSYLEKPELKEGDKTPLRSGMALAVDGNLTIPGTFACQFGDSIVVTESGYESLTDYPRQITIV